MKRIQQTILSSVGNLFCNIRGCPVEIMWTVSGRIYWAVQRSVIIMYHHL